ncbi:hypothetical protein [Trueperella sp.]|uniref:hypothetical protein n=1 Tax=Trueperella sp. TaxID=2699835 RepID=UPI0037353594
MEKVVEGTLDKSALAASLPIIVLTLPLTCTLDTALFALGGLACRFNAAANRLERLTESAVILRADTAVS